MAINRRDFLIGTGTSSLALLFPQIARALSIEANVRTGTIQDVEHVVILMQENRSFDHYFGTMSGVNGYSSAHPIPVDSSVNGVSHPRTVIEQCNRKKTKHPFLKPFLLNTRKNFNLMRVEGTPHTWSDAQAAWDNGRMAYWPEAKHDHSMGYYEQADIPFQYALAEAFTLCDAYHCSIQAGTNPNRVFMWAGTNDPSGLNGGPVIGNSHDNLPINGGAEPAYTFKTYVERLEDAGIEWIIYQDMKDNFTDNPLVGFKSFQASFNGDDAANPRLASRGLTTRKLDQLQADVLANKLPSVSYIIATAEGSEHPGPSSPAQGAAYTAEVLEALTSNPDVWSKTVLFVNYDENDGFFDHAPPPAPPSPDSSYKDGYAGKSQISTKGEYHNTPSVSDAEYERDEYMGRPYGLGPRVPAYVVSPWSRGGFVNSEVLDHTSIIRFLEARFGVYEPNISPWRRAVCGDFINAFDFAQPNNSSLPKFPNISEDAQKAAMLKKTTTPITPIDIKQPKQKPGLRPHRPNLYNIDVDWIPLDEDKEISLVFHNHGKRAVVFHVYNRLNLKAIPRRYTVMENSSLKAAWGYDKGAYDLQIVGPEGFHRRFSNSLNNSLLEVSVTRTASGYSLKSTSKEPLLFQSNQHSTPYILLYKDTVDITAESDGTYSATVTAQDNETFIRQFSGRLAYSND